MATYLLSKVAVAVTVAVVVCIFLFTCNVEAKAGIKSNLSLQKLEIQNHLNRLNKPPVKSIKSPDGDIIDCVHITHQPAFDHHSLKNHTIQKRPNYLPESVFVANKVHAKGSKLITQLWHLNGQCPKHTIPTRRIKQDDLLRASSVRTFGRKTHKTIPQSSFMESDDNVNLFGNEFATVHVHGDKYYGAKASMNVWKPKVQQANEYSSSQIWIFGTGGTSKDLTAIEAGWQVSPALYGDNNTRLFIYWTSDSYHKSGCFDLHCSGFIQTSKNIVVGGSISPLSNYGGSQYEINIFIWKDPIEGHWWLQFGEDEVVGYWPFSILPNLVDSASRVDFGGSIVNTFNNSQHTTTQMGSGHFPQEGFGKASYLRNIQIIDASHVPTPPQNITIFKDQAKHCYDIIKGKPRQWEDYFFYGGLGRNPNCL